MSGMSRSQYPKANCLLHRLGDLLPLKEPCPRRRHPLTEKRRMVELTFEPGASGGAPGLARRHSIAGCGRRDSRGKFSRSAASVEDAGTEPCGCNQARGRETRAARSSTALATDEAEARGPASIAICGFLSSSAAFPHPRRQPQQPHPRATDRRRPLL